MIAATTPKINDRAAVALDDVMVALVIEFADELGLASDVETYTRLLPNGDEETVTNASPSASDVTLACRQPVTMASVLADIAARLGIPLNPMIAAALDEPVSVITEGATAPSPTFQA